MLPPATQIVLILVAIVIRKRNKMASIALLAFALISLWLLSLPVVSKALMGILEAPYLTQENSVMTIPPDVVVVLGAGRKDRAPEFEGRDQVNSLALVRLRYAAVIAKQFKVPIIISGGVVYAHEEVSEAKLAAQVLLEEFGVSSEIWLEGASQNTWENARNTALFINEKRKAMSLNRVVLVTHAYHMQRAEFSFVTQGIEIIPRATYFYSTQSLSWRNAWLPKVQFLMISQMAMHEILGLMFYKTKYKLFFGA